MIGFTHYFKLQFIWLKRHLVDFGIHPLPGLVIILLAFIGFSFYLFAKTEYANYLYVLAALSTVFHFAETNRNELLKLIYPKNTYLKIRVTENLITVLPFTIFLCLKQAYFSAMLLLVLAASISFSNSKWKAAATIPTPFYAQPFEFLVGFRKSLIAFLFAYLLAIISIIYQNFNLGLFSLALVFLICLSFYTEPEGPFYVWIFKQHVNGFLFQKIKTAIVYSTAITLPIIILLVIFLRNSLVPILVCQALGYTYLATIILAKYAAFPQKINLPLGLLLAFSLALPPLLLAFVPYCYFQAHKRLKEILA